MTDVIISGIGGQGTVSIGHIVSYALNKAEILFVSSETHGMSQRGGSVVFHLRIGPDKRSPLIAKGSADIILAGEPMEGVRVLDYLKPNGIVITGTHPILSPVAKKLGLTYPDLGDMFTAIENWPAALRKVNALEIAKEIGNKKVANIVLLGSLLKENILPISSSIIQAFIEKRWPNNVVDNTKALQAGLNFDSLKVGHRTSN